MSTSQTWLEGTDVPTYSKPHRGPHNGPKEAGASRTASVAPRDSAPVCEASKGPRCRLCYFGLSPLGAALAVSPPELHWCLQQGTTRTQAVEFRRLRPRLCSSSPTGGKSAFDGMAPPTPGVSAHIHRDHGLTVLRHLRPRSRFKSAAGPGLPDLRALESQAGRSE